MTLVASLLAVALAGGGDGGGAGQHAALVCPKGTERKGDAPPEGFEQWCEGHDGFGHPRREGPYRSWYDDGGIWVEKTYKEGELEGAFVERHRNGKPAREGAYARGRKVGAWSVFYDSGKLEERSEWRDGAAHGRFASYWPTGALRTEGRHCGGVQCGRWRTFGLDGKVVGEVDYGEQRLVP